MIQLHSKAFKGWRFWCVAEGTGAVDSCLVLRAGLILRSCKERKREKLSSVYTTVISARAHFLFATTEKIFPGKMGLRLELVQHSSTAVGCGADGGILKCCVQKFWTSWQGVFPLLHWKTGERKINMYCENRHKIRRDLCDVQYDCSLV